ncbi:hypothetical protein QUF72_08495 [Desulfobacterales bacterium HSG2]|nr:hypothetical protein [Desulfobacterales bacterium HSG2]
MTDDKTQVANDKIPDVEKEISELLRKQEKDYLTVAQVRNGLSLATLKFFGLTRKSNQTDVLKKLEPYFGNSLQNYHPGKTTYIGFKMSIPDVEKEISDLLRKEGKDSLTVTQVRKILSLATLKFFGLTRKSSLTDVLKKLKPYLGESLQNYKGPFDKAYIGFKMSLDKLPDIEKEISDLLKKKEEDYLTVKKVRDGLSSATLKSCELKKKSNPTDVLKKLEPHFGNSLQNYTGYRKTTYIGFKMSLDEILFKKVEQNPGLSQKQLGMNFPMSIKEYIPVLNDLLKAGRIVCTFNSNRTPILEISQRIPISAETEKSEGESVNDRDAFKAAYDEVGRGRDFVRIHSIREYLNWSREHFDSVLIELRGSYTIRLHGGDPSTMTEKEIQDSFMDEKGRLRINVTWRGNDE